MGDDGLTRYEAVLPRRSPRVRLARLIPEWSGSLCRTDSIKGSLICLATGCGWLSPARLTVQACSI